MFPERTKRQIPVTAQLFLASTVAIALIGCSITSSAEEYLDLDSSSNISAEQNDVEIRALVQQVHRGVNQYRASLKLPPLSLNAQVNEQAEIHSQNMAQQVVKFSHHGFKTRVGALEGQITYRRAAENVAFNQGYEDPVQTAIAGWIKSEGHHQNMIGNFNLTGIGVAKNRQGEYYFTQIFIKEN